MKNFKNLLLILMTALSCLAMVIIPIFVPRLVIAPFDFHLILVIILAAMVASVYITPKVGENSFYSYFLSIIISALAFGVLPLCSGLTTPAEAARLALMGGVTYAVADPVFHSLTQRLDSGKSTVFAPVGNAFILFLAAQGLVGML